MDNTARNPNSEERTPEHSMNVSDQQSNQFLHQFDPSGGFPGLPVRRPRLPVAVPGTYQIAPSISNLPPSYYRRYNASHLHALSYGNLPGVLIASVSATNQLPQFAYQPQHGHQYVASVEELQCQHPAMHQPSMTPQEHTPTQLHQTLHETYESVYQHSTYQQPRGHQYVHGHVATVEEPPYHLPAMQQPSSTFQGRIAPQLHQTPHETYESVYQDRQQQFNSTHSTSSENRTQVREQRNISQGKGSSYHQGPANNVVIKNDNRVYQQPSCSSGQEQSMSLEELNELTTKLQGALKTSARKKSAKLPCPVRDKQVTYVSLQIVLKSGRSSKREIKTRFNDRKQMLKTLRLKAPKGKFVNLKELLERVQERTEVNSCNCVNENCDYSVGIIGPAGIGKTTCTLELTKLICTGEILGYDYVFLVRLRNVDYNKEKATSLLEFLLTSSGSDFSCSSNEEKALMKILQDSSNVMLILDGVDEARFQQKKTPYVRKQLFDRANAEDFIKNILAGNLLPHAVKFVTSRPEQMFELHLDCRPHFVASILGLSDESRQELCKQISNDKHKEVGDFLQNHPEIYAYCYIPVFCILATSSITDAISHSSETENLSTISGIMISAFLKFVKSSHMQQVKHLISELQKLFQLAQNGFLNHEVLFNERHFTECKIGKKTRNAFLEASNELDFSVNILSGETQFYFSHMVWQEFFTAIGLLVFTEYVDFEKYYSIFDDSAWEVVIKFMYGLLSPKTFMSLKSIFNDISLNENSRNLLKKFVLSFATIQFTSEKNTEKFLRVCSWLFEAQDDDLTKEFAQALSANIDLAGPLLPGDVVSLHYVLRKCKKASTLMLQLQFHGKCLPQFFKEMSKTLQDTKIVIKQLKIRDRINVEAVPLVFNCLNGTVCDFCRCQLSKAAFKALFSAIEGSTQPLKKINISNNNLGDDGVSHISTCLSKIEELDIGKCKISASGIKSISDAISTLPEPIHYLNLSGNKFGDAGVPFIMSCLDKIEKLYMTDCDITEEGVHVITEHIKNCTNLPKVLEFNYDKMNQLNVLCCGLDLLDNNGDFSNLDLTLVGVKALVAAINKLPQPIDRLNLSENKFGDAGVPFIMSCLDKIDKLYMTDCNITEEGVRLITEHIKNCSNLPKVLEFSYDEMNQSEVLRCDLDLLGNGYFSNLDLTPVGWEALAAAINKLPKPMKNLSLWGNDLGDDGASHISTCLNKIEDLHIGWCKISASGIKSISDAISKLPEPMKKLSLWGNDLGDDGASHISTFLSKIEELNIILCNISASGIKSISDAISKLPEPKPKVFGLEWQF